MRRQIVHKLIIAATGLFLTAFIVVHLGGNLQLLLEPTLAKEQFNAYSHFMASSRLIGIASIVTSLSLVLHIAVSLRARLRNGRARPQRYRGFRPPGSWYGRSMALLGVFVFLFLVVHLADYWVPLKWGGVASDKAGRADLYTLVERSFQSPWRVTLYLACSIALGFHLAHGLGSAAASLGLGGPRASRVAATSGVVLAGLLALGFGLIPLVLYFRGSHGL